MTTSNLVRQSNFELLRIIAMLMVIAVHTNYYNIGVVDSHILTTRMLPISLCAFFESICVVCVNVFVLISGWFGIKPSWKGGASIIFQVFFYCLLIAGVFIVLELPVSLKDVGKSFLLGSSYWFVPSYILLYCFAPVLNSFVESVSRASLRNFLIVFFVLEFIYGVLRQDGNFIHGYSAISFMGLYLLARYVRLYPGRWLDKSAGFYWIVFFACSVINSALMIGGMYYAGHPIYNLTFYSSPIVVVGAVSLLLAFSKMEFQSKAINFCAASAFAMYLIHQNNLIAPYWYPFFIKQFETSPFHIYLIYSVVVIAGLFVLSVVVDRVRIWLWKFALKLLFR